MQGAVDAWVAAGDVAAWLCIVGASRRTSKSVILPANVLHLQCTSCTTLPALPAFLETLLCSGCPLLRCLPALPAALLYLNCADCPLLRALPALPAALLYLNCADCPLLRAPPALPAALKSINCVGCTSLRALPALPIAVTRLYRDECTALPDAHPPGLKLGTRILYPTAIAVYVDSAHEWRREVACRHTEDRERTASALPAALLYV